MGLWPEATHVWRVRPFALSPLTSRKEKCGGGDQIPKQSDLTSFWVGEHLKVLGVWCAQKSWKICTNYQASFPAPPTLPYTSLKLSCSWVLSFIINWYTQTFVSWINSSNKLNLRGFKNSSQVGQMFRLSLNLYLKQNQFCGTESLNLYLSTILCIASVELLDTQLVSENWLLC